MSVTTLKSYKPIEMLNNLPLDVRSYYKSYNDALEYANTSTVAYEGQVISIKMENGQIGVYSLRANTSGIGGNFILTPVGDHVSFKTVTALPTKDIEDIIYILSTNNIGYIYVNNAWKPLIYPKVDTINESTPSTNKLTSEKAVTDFVSKKITEANTNSDAKYVTNVTYNKTNGNINIVKEKSSSNIVLEGLIHNPTFDANTRTFTFPIFGQATPLKVSLGKDIFIDPTKDNKYNPTTGNIELFLNDGSIISIPAKELVDVYKAESTSTIQTEVTANNIIKSNIRISKKANNALSIIPLTTGKETEYGLYVENKDFQPSIDRSLQSAKSYTDQKELDIRTLISEINKNLTQSDTTVLSESKKYADTLIKNFTYITQNTISVSFISTSNQKSFTLTGVTYNPDSDVVELYINGLKQSPDVVEKTNSTTISLKIPLPAGYDVSFKITKLDMSSDTATTS